MSGFATHTTDCDEVPMNLTVSKDSNLPVTIEEVEADHVAPVNLIKIEVVDPSSPASPKPANEMEGVKEEPTTEETEAKADDDDLETDHMPIVRPLEKLTPIAGRLKMGHKGDSVSTSKSERRALDQQSSDKKMLKTVEGELVKEKAIVKGLQHHVTECEDMVIDAVMNYATTGDPLYFVSQFRHFLTVRDEYGDNSLHMAVINRQHRALRDMLSICTATKTLPAINQLNDKHQTPIHLATILGDVEMVRVLLNHSADPSIKDQNGNNCFHVAARNGDYRVMEHLCEWLALSKADKSVIDEFNYEGETALHAAVQVDSIECIRKFITAGASINMADRTTGRTPLHHAVLKGNVVTTAELVFQVNIEVDAQAYDGNSPLHLAISVGNMDICRMLIKSGANPLMKNRDYTPREMEEDKDEAIGMTAYDMCARDEKLLAAIRSALSKDNKAPHLVGSIESLPKNTTNKLSNLLDHESHDWKRLANKFDLSSLVDYMENSGNPTVSLLNYLAKNDKTIKDLAQALVAISRLDCVEVIEKWNPSATGRNISAVVDSGFVESFASGTTRSGQMK